MRIGLTELVVIIIVLVALIKPDKLVETARRLGQATKVLKEQQASVEDGLSGSMSSGASGSEASVGSEREDV